MCVYNGAKNEAHCSEKKRSREQGLLRQVRLVNIKQESLRQTCQNQARGSRACACATTTATSEHGAKLSRARALTTTTATSEQEGRVYTLAPPQLRQANTERRGRVHAFSPRRVRHEQIIERAGDFDERRAVALTLKFCHHVVTRHVVPVRTLVTVHSRNDLKQVADCLKHLRLSAVEVCESIVSS
jgi:hypothetical protein